MKKIIFTITLICNLNLIAQNLQIAWEKTIGGSLADTPSKIIKTIDGGYLICGTSNSNMSGNKSQNCYGYVDYWIVKLDMNGNILWEKTIGGSASDNLTSAIETSSGDIILAGSSNSDISYDKTENSRGGLDFWVVKINSLGTIIWDKTYGGSGYERLMTIDKLNDNELIIGGYSNSDVSGDKNENSRGNYDYWMLKIDGNGSIIWQKTIGGSNVDILRSLKYDLDGNILLAGESNSTISGDRTISQPLSGDIWLLKLSNSGSIIWQKSFLAENISNILVNSSNEYVLLVTRPWSTLPLKTSQLSFSTYSIIFKIDNSGNMIWNYTNYGANPDNITSDLIEVEDGYVYTSNYQYSIPIKAVVSKISFSGSLVWNHFFETDSNEQIPSICKSNNGLVCVVNSAANSFGDKTENSFGQNDYWVVGFQPETLNLNSNSKNDFIVYPNPVDRYVTIKNSSETNYNLLIYNSLGQIVFQKEKISSLEYQTDLDLPNGSYFLKIEDQENNFKIFKINKL